MQLTFSERITESFYAIAAEPSDTPDFKFYKTLAVTSMLVSIPALLVWACAYFYFAETGVSIILTTYAFVLAVLLILIRLQRARFNTFLFIGLGGMLATGFLATLVLGGIANSTGLFFYCLIAPFAVVVHPDRPFAVWFAVCVGIVVVEIALQPWLRSSNQVPLGVSNLFWGLNFFTLLALLYGNLISLLTQRDRARELLQAEQIKSENLLLNILPPEIAQVLKNENRIIADQIEVASILFADVVNFTPMSATMAPAELVSLLNEVFSQFDALVEKYNLEKIKTIGDCYMVAAGVPSPRPDHAQALVRLALDMQAYVAQNEILGRRLQFRIGINSGPVVAGVIGRKKFAYDLWGDTVNTASRMESHGSGGNVQITQDTYNLIKHDFNCESRGSVNVKGKGEISVWHVTDILA